MAEGSGGGVNEEVQVPFDGSEPLDIELMTRLSLEEHKTVRVGAITIRRVVRGYPYKKHLSYPISL